MRSSFSESSNNVSVFDSYIYRDLFGTKEIRAIFNDDALINKWLMIEKALSKSEANLGIIPNDAYEDIKKTIETMNINYDDLREETNKVGRSIKPLLAQIKSQGTQKVSEYLHFGTTTQDIMDTATMLQIKEGLRVVRNELVMLTLQITDLAEKNKDTVMIARSNGQDAVPTTFGLQLSTYMMALYRDVKRIDEVNSRLQIQFGSTVGTLAPFGKKGLKLQQLISKELKLKAPIAPWNPSRDVFVETIQTLSLIDGTLGRLSLDINNLSRTQIAEIQEGEGGASSTMPQKRNPRASEYMGGLYRMGQMYNSASLDMMSHTDTRQGAPWILEWSIIPSSFMVTSSSLARAKRFFNKIIIHKDKMLSNFASSNNYVLSEAVMNAVVKKIGRSKAYSTVKEAIKNADPSWSLRKVIEKDKVLSKLLNNKELESLLNPSNYIGVAPEIVERSVKEIRDNLVK